MIVLTGYSSSLQPFLYLLYDFNETAFFSGNKRKIGLNLPFHQVEGIATTDGLKFYISNEYFNQFTINVPQKIHTLNLSSYLQNYLANNGPSERILNLTILLEGLFNGTSMNKAQNGDGYQFTGDIADQILLELRSTVMPYELAGGPFPVLLNTDGSAVVTVPGFFSDSYYLVVRHRNSIETWSSLPLSFNSPVINYNFTSSASQAYGNNLKFMSGKFLIYTGDVNQDGIVDSGDMTPVDNDATLFVTGYISSDVNGDGVVDTGDMTMIDNNGSLFISVASP